MQSPQRKRGTLRYDNETARYRARDREVERLLSKLEIKSFATRDEQEVAGYAETMELIFQSWEQIMLTENHVKQLHRDLLQYSEKDAHRFLPMRRFQ